MQEVFEFFTEIKKNGQYAFYKNKSISKSELGFPFNLPEEKLTQDNQSAGMLLVASDDLYPYLQQIKTTCGFLPEILLLVISPDIKRTPIITDVEKLGFRVYEEFEYSILFLKIQSKALLLKAGLQLHSEWEKIKLDTISQKLINIDSSTQVQIKEYPAAELLVPERFDIAIKLLYGRLWKAKRAKSWRLYTYQKHIKMITGDNPQLSEFDGMPKSGLEAYLETFESLIQTNKSLSIPLVPVDQKNIAIDGAHRIAAAIVAARPVRAVQIEASSPSQAPSTFFQTATKYHAPCPEEILDEAAIEYCRTKTSVALALVFPVVSSTAFAKHTLKEVSSIVYEKTFFLTSKMGSLLLQQVYLDHSWFQGEAASLGFMHKTQACFPHAGNTTALLLDRFEYSKLRETKELIRRHYQLGNHSIHITDGLEETRRVAKLVFNQNSLFMLNMTPNPNLKFWRIFETYRQWRRSQPQQGESICIGGSALLALIGHRDANDIDFISTHDPSEFSDYPEKIDSHDKVACFYPHPFDEIIGDPRKHFWFMGEKFCSPQVIWEMKNKRGEPKDHMDCLALQQFMQQFDQHQLSFWKRIKTKLLKTKILMYRRLSPIKHKTILNLKTYFHRYKPSKRNQKRYAYKWLDTLRPKVNDIINVPAPQFSATILSESTPHNDWGEYCLRIMNELKSSPAGFLRLPTISFTLHPNDQDLATAYLQEMKKDSYASINILPRLKDCAFGDPYLSHDFPYASPLSLQAAYYLTLIYRKLGVSLLDNEAELITEIGGGYGNLARILRQLGCQTPVHIVDLPVMHTLQQHFHQYVLTKQEAINIVYATTENALQFEIPRNAILIATFSLSEMPIETRDLWVISFQQYRYLLFAYNKSFFGVDNLTYFNRLAQSLNVTHNVELIRDRYRVAWFILCKKKES